MLCNYSCSHNKTRIDINMTSQDIFTRLYFKSALYFHVTISKNSATRYPPIHITSSACKYLSKLAMYHTRNHIPCVRLCLPSIYASCECSETHYPPHNEPHTPATAVLSEPIPTIDALYSPKFPLEVVRTFVMEALHEAVEVNQVHNRDPIGWSNENLFLYVLRVLQPHSL